jgi:hypothetical protein
MFSINKTEVDLPLVIHYNYYSRSQSVHWCYITIAMVSTCFALACKEAKILLHSFVCVTGHPTLMEAVVARHSSAGNKAYLIIGHSTAKEHLISTSSIEFDRIPQEYNPVPQESLRMVPKAESSSHVSSTL